MSGVTPALLVLAVGAVGVLHTLVPDHWAPIALLARQQGWSSRAAVRAAAVAGVGHTVSTLVVAAIVWTAGAVFAHRFANLITIVSAAALVAFGLYIAIAALRELRGEHGHDHFGHMHWHSHGSLVHRHWHQHHEHHAVEGNLALAVEPESRSIPGHEHAHPRRSARTALLIVLGSSPMVEGIPAFFAAGRFGAATLAIMSVVFAASTIATYALLVGISLRGLERVSLGRFERYGEVISGAFVAVIGAVFFFM